jgi:hypothetical protein
LKHSRVNKYLVLKVQYPDATNFEGVKIMVFDREVRLMQLNQQGFIDPHFSTQALHPIARFIPTGRGWEMAVNFARNLP